MPRTACLALIAICLAGGVAQPKPDGVDTRPVSVVADDLSLTEVLADVARQAGVGVVLRGTSVPDVTLSLKGVPFSDAMNVLADAFSLLSYWEQDTVVVWVLQEALSQVERELAAGRTETVTALCAVASSSDGTYGTQGQAAQVAVALNGLIQDRARRVLSGELTDAHLATALATAPTLDKDTRAALAATAVRLLLRDGDIDGALQAWDKGLQGSSQWAAKVAEAELLLHLHYTGDPRAADYFAASFNVDHAVALLNEGWRRKTYQDALHLARLYAKYAWAAGRSKDARTLEIAIESCLASPRLIQVTCVVDREATGDPQWQSRVRARVAKCSEAFQQQAGIQFAVTEMLSWDPPADSDFGNKYEALKAALAGRTPELTIGFILEVFQMTPAEFDAADKHFWVGFGCPHNGAFLLARDFSFESVVNDALTQWALSSETVAQTLTHEMAHMFGALHSDSPASAMYPASVSPPSFTFDEANRAIIQRHKWQDMSTGAMSLDEPELQGLIQDYRSMQTGSEMDNGARLEEARAHLALARLYERRRDPERAAEEARQVLAIGEPADIAAEAQEMLGTP